MPSPLEKPLPVEGTTGLVADCGSRLAVIVTHPWGPLGGNMHNNVVVAVSLYFQRLNITTVRFDFSASQFSRGHAQVQQVQTIADALIQGKCSDDATKKPEKILLVGYSYGSLIAGSASAVIDSCIGSISIAPPFGVSHWLLLFNSDHHMQQAALKEELPRLFLIGSSDNFTTEEKFRNVVENRFPQQRSTGAVLKKADHFFNGREKDTLDVIGEWILSTFDCDGKLANLRQIEFS